MRDDRIRSAGETLDLAFRVFWTRGAPVALIYALGIVPLAVVVSLTRAQTVLDALFSQAEKLLVAYGGIAHHRPLHAPPQEPWATSVTFGLELVALPMLGIAAVRAAYGLLAGTGASIGSCLVEAMKSVGRLFSMVVVWSLAALTAAVVITIVSIAVISTDKQNLGFGTWFLVGEILVTVLAYPIALMLFSWSFVAVGLDRSGGFQAAMAGLRSVFRKGTFVRAFALGAIAMLLSIFMSGLQIAATALNYPGHTRLLDFVVGAGGDIVVASMSTIIYVAFFLDEKARDRLAALQSRPSETELGRA